MKMKSILAMSLVAALSISMLAGCTKKDTGSGSSTPSSSMPSSSADKNMETGMLTKIHTSVKDAFGESYIPSMKIEEAQIAEVYGVKKEWYKDVVAEGPMISTHVDAFIGFEATDEKSAMEIEKALKAYKKTLEEDSMQYPMNLPKVKASTVHKNGNYVFFMMLGDIDAITMPEKEEDQLKAAEAEIKKGMDAIENFFKK